MRRYPHNSPEAAARILALVLIADGRVCPAEFDILQRLGAERELGLEPRLLPHIVHNLREELLAAGAGRDGLGGAIDEALLARLAAEISDPALQAAVRHLSQAVAQADGQLADDEIRVLDALRRHWRAADATASGRAGSGPRKGPWARLRHRLTTGRDSAPACGSSPAPG